MEEFIDHTFWTEWKNIFLRPFQTATLEFVWEEKLEITTRIFMQCIILQCVMLNYWTTYLLRNIQYNSTDPDHNIILEGLHGDEWQKVLEMNARVIRNHKFSVKELFLVYDLVFPSKTKNFVLQSKIVHDPNKPIKFPTAILTPVTNTLRLFTHNAFVTSSMTVTPLLFINLNDHSISVGCIPCESSFFKNWKITSEYQITLETPPEKFAAFTNLIQFWKTLHSTLNWEHLRMTNCRTMPEAAFGTNFKYELCEIYEEYSKYLNCSNFMECTWFHINNQGVRKNSIKADGLFFHFNAKIFPCGLEQNDYTLQVLFPKVQFFDANLTALLVPFTLNIWLYTLAAIAGVAIWLVFLGSVTLFSSLFQIYSILVSQDAGKITGRQAGRTLILIIWIFSAFLLREAYNSSLYSFMTAEQDFEDFPKSMKGLLDRNDFDLILPLSFHDEVMFVLYRWKVYELPTSISAFYMKIFKRAYIMKRSVHQEALEIISSGGTYPMLHYPNSLTQNSTVTEWLDSLLLQRENVRTNKFAVLCEGQCEKKWNIALLGSPGLERVKPTQNAFFRSFEFWEIGKPIFLSFTFSRFLGPFVESGIHDLVMNRYRLLEKVNRIKTSQNMIQLRMKNNFSIVSYALFANGRRNFDNEIKEKPTNIKALTGTFIVTGVKNIFMRHGTNCLHPSMLFPKVQFFDANLTAFLTPFTLNLWLFTLAAIAGIVIWMVLVGSDRIFNSLFQMYSSLLSQDFGQITERRPGTTLIIIIWIFSAILLREAYNSSLYSFLTAEQDFKDFPNSMEELLDRNDFHLVLPISFHDEVMFLFYFWNVAKLPASIATFYMKIVIRAHFMRNRFYKETLETISSGGTYIMLQYPSSVTRNYAVTDWFESLNALLSENVTTKRFAVLCEGQCETKWNIALLGNPGLERVIPAQNAFSRSFEFWTIWKPNFLTPTFSKFLRSFVESGIHDLLINRYRLLKNINLIKTSQNMIQLRMKSNFSIVNYALFANGRRDLDNEIKEKPTKIKALTRTFIITGAMMGISLALILLELLNQRIFIFYFNRLRLQVLTEAPII
ncbi:unnamed protein product [Orchesella dallaii]|uniref:Uncharacterized protein n=1 Tax=Orchesella dallaii TaxID=48710 RepID=A0ABP1RHB8_9HEXA